MDPLLVLFSVCGISVVCLGLIGVLAVLLLRFTGRNLFQGVGGLEGVVGALAGVGDDSGDDDYERLQRKSPQRRDLRAEAQSLDFQSTVEKYRTGQPGAQSARPANPAPRPPATNTNPFDTPPSLADRRTTQRRRDESGEDEDGLMGSFLDDGDGPLV